MLWRDGGPIDTDGNCLIELSNGAVATLEWKINSAYRNEIDVWGEEASLFTDKLFSKPAAYTPMFRLRNVQGVETIEYGEAANHFVLMLEAFRRSIPDDRAMESERRAIAQRAEVLDRIWSVSSLRSVQSV
jgi:hypothetical protein